MVEDLIMGHGEDLVEGLGEEQHEQPGDAAVSVDRVVVEKQLDATRAVVVCHGDLRLGPRGGGEADGAVDPAVAQPSDKRCHGLVAAGPLGQVVLNLGLG